jgi:purine-nucleoside phosphorylase
MSILQELDAAVHAVRAKTSATPLIGVVLGSGLAGLADALDAPTRIPYRDIPAMPASSVDGHPGNFFTGTMEGVPIACLQGRVHLYEGHAAQRVVFGVRLLARLGCRAVLLTNAAGGLHPSLQPGDFMLVTGHLNLTGHNPLVGPNIEQLGPRFPDMSDAYDKRLNTLARETARDAGVRLHDGVYAGLLGPSYETPAEIAMLRTLGADAVGMSTVCEVIALRHMGVRTAAISCITNLAAGLAPGALSHADVEEVAKTSRERLQTLFAAWIRKIGPFLLLTAGGHGVAV